MHWYETKIGKIVQYQMFICSVRRFFVESISYLHDNATVELFYQQAKQSVYKVDPL